MQNSRLLVRFKFAAFAAILFGFLSSYAFATDSIDSSSQSKIYSLAAAAKTEFWSAQFATASVDCPAYISDRSSDDIEISFVPVSSYLRSSVSRQMRPTRTQVFSRIIDIAEPLGLDRPTAGPITRTILWVVSYQSDLQLDLRTYRRGANTAG